jgi:hypothetical protein
MFSSKKRPRVIRILHSIGGFLPSISVAVVILCRTRVPPTVHHSLWCHPACSQKSMNRTHQSPQTHPQRTLFYIESEVDLCRFLLCGMAHPLAYSIEHLQCWTLLDNTPNILCLPQRCPHNTVELRGPPHIGGPNPPSKPQIQNTHKEIWLFEPNMLILDVW